MQQRQPRLGDILDDYCPRERRLTNHAVVAMIGNEIRQTRCTTCEAEHEYKHAKVPRQRRKNEEPAALYSQVLAGGPKRVSPEPTAGNVLDDAESHQQVNEQSAASSAPIGAEDPVVEPSASLEGQDESDLSDSKETEEGPVHRQLIRATLPRQDGAAPVRPAPDFTIRQPGGRQNRFRPRNHGGQTFQGNRSNGSMGGGGGRGGASRQNGGRHSQGAMSSRPTRHHDPGRKRSK